MPWKEHLVIWAQKSDFVARQPCSGASRKSQLLSNRIDRARPAMLE